MAKTKGKTGGNLRINISEYAYQNISQITGYIAYVKREPEIAKKIGDHIFQKIDQISLNPFSFRECEEIPTKLKIYRKAVCLSWVIIYKISDTEITILGIIHSSRNPTVIKKLDKSR